MAARIAGEQKGNRAWPGVLQCKKLAAAGGAPSATEGTAAAPATTAARVCALAAAAAAAALTLHPSNTTLESTLCCIV